MSINITTWTSLTIVWVIFATVFGYIFTKDRVKKPLVTNLFNFLLAFLPPVSVIVLLILFGNFIWNDKKIAQ